MKNKVNFENFDVNEFKEQMKKIKETSAEAKKNYKHDTQSKEPFGKKILGIIILVVLIIGVILALITNLEVLFLPKNSITINIFDQNKNSIENIKINLHNTTGVYYQDHTIESSLTILDAEPGEYTLTFEEIPDGYTCSDLVDTFTLNENGKIKLEYECTKN